MPKGIVTQVIIAMHRWIAGPNCVWKSGVMFDKENTLCEVIEDYYAREIKVRAVGQHKKELLTIVDYELGKIHDTYKDLKYKKLIPCNCSMCIDLNDPEFYDSAVLRKFAADGQRDIQCRKSYEMVRVQALIDDVRDVSRADPESNTEHPGLTVYGNVGHVMIDQSGGRLMKNTAQPEEKITGAFQLRQDQRLAEKPFMELLKLVIGQLPLLSRFANSRSAPDGKGDGTGSSGSADVRRRGNPSARSSHGRS
jgi:internalin A